MRPILPENRKFVALMSVSSAVLLGCYLAVGLDAVPEEVGKYAFPGIPVIAGVALLASTVAAGLIRYQAGRPPPGF